MATVLVIDAGSKVLVVDHFVGQGRVVNAPHVNSFLVDGQAVASRRMKDFGDVAVFKKLLESAGREEFAVDSSSKKVD